MLTLWQDLRFGFRSFARTPGFTLVIILTLALGIGANTAIFSVLNAAVLRPLPYPQPDRLAMVFTQFPTLNLDQFPLSAPEYLEYKELNASFESLAAFRTDTVSVAGAAEPVRATVIHATADLWSVLRVDPQRGRTFTADEDVPGPASDVAVLSHELWQRSFNADPAIIGKTIQVNSVPTTVLGIMPPGFDLLDADAEIWMPMAFDPAHLPGRGGHNYRIVGRLTPGVTVDQATAELAGIYQRWDEIAANQHHPRLDDEHQHPMEIHSLGIVAMGDTRPALFMLLGIVGFVLLIACANVANLLLARSEVRRRELAVRLALGAPRRRMVRQLLTESITLALLGGAVGLLLAWWTLNIMLAFIPDSVPRVDEIRIDPLVLGFTLVVACATGILFGLAPIIRLSMPRLHAALKAAGSRSTDGAEHHRFRNLLVVGEVALALVLISGAGLMIRSFWRLQQVDPGFDPRGVLTLNLALPAAEYPEGSQVIAFYEDLLRRVEALPDVAAAAVATGLPPRRHANFNSHNIRSRADIPDQQTPNFDFIQIATPGYFDALGIPLERGRLFDDQDGGDAEPVVVINHALAAKFWPDGDPLDDAISDWSDPPNWFRVVGIVGDARQNGMENDVGTEYFIPFRQIPKFGFVPREMNLIVKSASGNALAQVAPVTDTIRTLDASLPIADIETMDGRIYDAVATQRFATVLLTAFGILAASLAAIGIYSVMAFSVAQRTNEFGIRMALGAERADVHRLVLRQGAVLSLVGVVLGLTFAIVLARLLSVQLDAILYDLSPSDPLTLVVVAGLLIATAIAACIVPARRATRVDPMIALRYE